MNSESANEGRGFKYDDVSRPFITGHVTQQLVWRLFPCIVRQVV